jgi:hypothetical protein
MGRLAALFIFSAIGFSIGFLGYVASPTMNNWLSGAVPGFILNQLFLGAVVAGIVASLASAFVVNRWSKQP